jgi:hypothetical protein
LAEARQRGQTPMTRWLRRWDAPELPALAWASRAAAQPLSWRGVAHGPTAVGLA